MIIFNPAAGQIESPERELAVAAEVWGERGWRVDLRPTAGPGDATRLAREGSNQGYDLVVAAGGDGTINEVVNGLVYSRTAMATLPLGTMNVWARELGLPLTPRAAAAALLNWQVRSIDLGRAGNRYFLLMAGIGIDAAITSNVRSAEKRRFGAFVYVLSTLNLLPRIRGTRARLIIDGRTVKGRVLWIVIGNSQLYGGLVKITHRASIDDGLLDVCMIRGDSFPSAVARLGSILLRRYTVDPDITYYRARSIRVETRPSLPVQVDGDTIGKTPMEFVVVPGALRALLPPELTTDLVQAAPPTTALARTGRGLQRLISWLGRKSVP